MKDNRIFRPELMNEKEREDFSQTISDYVAHENEKAEKRQTEQAEQIKKKIESGEYIEKNGKIYDARYYKEG